MPTCPDDHPPHGERLAGLDVRQRRDLLDVAVRYQRPWWSVVSVALQAAGAAEKIVAAGWSNAGPRLRSSLQPANGTFDATFNGNWSRAPLTTGRNFNAVSIQLQRRRPRILVAGCGRDALGHSPRRHLAVHRVQETGHDASAAAPGWCSTRSTTRTGAALGDTSQPGDHDSREPHLAGRLHGVLPAYPATCHRPVPGGAGPLRRDRQPGHRRSASTARDEYGRRPGGAEGRRPRCGRPRATGIVLAGYTIAGDRPATGRRGVAPQPRWLGRPGPSRAAWWNSGQDRPTMRASPPSPGLHLQPDGRIIVAGHVTMPLTPGSATSALARFWQ